MAIQEYTLCTFGKKRKLVPCSHYVRAGCIGREAVGTRLLAHFQAVGKVGADVGIGVVRELVAAVQVLWFVKQNILICVLLDLLLFYDT